MICALPKPKPLGLKEYAEKAEQTDRFTDIPGGSSKLTFGFFGEVGGLLAAVKKVNRDHLQESETEVAGEEVGDALWYLFAIASVQKVSAVTLGRSCLSSLRQRFHEGERDDGEEIDFRQIDGLIALHGTGLEEHRVELLAELAKKSGEVVGHGNGAQLELDSPTQTILLGQLLAILGVVCASFTLALEDVARDNLAKIHSRWPGKSPKYIDLFDEEFPKHEQLPRGVVMQFTERKTLNGSYVVQSLSGVYIGDRLTDNISEPDDYRFHDVFHLAYVVHLGWSPVIRALLKVKRKSDPKKDENEDGARAIIIEEGIATWIFNHAKKRRFYDDVEIGKLEYGLLKQIQSMVNGYEVNQCPLWQWEKAILDGFRIFREMRKPENRGGFVVADMINHTLEFKNE